MFGLCRLSHSVELRRTVRILAKQYNSCLADARQ
jgi:hypothetical protein